MQDRVGQELLDQHGDPVVQRRGEQQPLAAGGGGAQQPPDHRQEAEIGHVVGLVEHGDLDSAEVASPLVDQVLEPAGAGDDDVDTGAQGGGLVAVADAAEDDHGAQPGGRRERLDGAGDLQGEFAGGQQDQAARAGRRPGGRR